MIVPEVVFLTFTLRLNPLCVRFTDCIIASTSPKFIAGDDSGCGLADGIIGVDDLGCGAANGVTAADRRIRSAVSLARGVAVAVAVAVAVVVAVAVAVGA